jgi:hypothetical protein
MKTMKLVTVVAGIIFLFASCSESVTNVDEMISSEADIKSTELVAAPGDSCDFTAVLNDEEIDGLLEMREEEKLAGDVYRAFYKVHEHIIFDNISKSEDAHSSAVLHLINGFELIDPALEEEGVFTNPLFNQLYADLTSQGNSNLVDALKVGAFIEEYDIADLERLIEETENETIKRVYANLLRGSKIHIKAFTNVLKVYGETYTPTVISQEEYENILNEDTGNDDDSTTNV